MARARPGGGRTRTSSRRHGLVAGVGHEHSPESSNSRSLVNSASDTHSILAPAVYLVATPIGNASDITLRALDVLRDVDVIACEDTRVTSKLLSIHGISKPLVRYDEHAAATAGPQLIERVRRGERVAVVTDAGTPLVSDPGQRLVPEAIAAGVAVIAVPGPSAVLTALMVAGLPAEPFLFAGFLPPRTTARRKELARLAEVPATLVVLESPHRLADSLADMADVLGPRPAAIARELTKMFEEVRRGTLADLAGHYRDSGPPKGEVTVVIAPPLPAPAIDADEAERLLVEALLRLGPSEAAAAVASATGLSRRTLYARAVALKSARS